jgi:dihydroorotate dehydrogenase (fumarate)
MEDMGVGAIVLYSLFEEQITHESQELDHFLNLGTHSYAEALSYFPDMSDYQLTPERYLEHLRRVKEAVDIPVIGSLNGVSSGGWIRYARLIEEAGADALELNIYYLPTDPHTGGRELEEVYVGLVRDVRASISIPLAVKLSPFFTSIPNMASRFVEAGANGLVMFNRFYQPDLDLDELEVVPRVELSTSLDLLLPLRWIAILYGRVPVDFALTSGVHTARDALKALMAGANVCMLTSELLAHGVGRIRDITEDMLAWMREHEYESVTQMRGSMSQRAVAEPAAFERANYIRTLQSFRATS